MLVHVTATNKPSARHGDAAADPGWGKVIRVFFSSRRGSDADGLTILRGVFCYLFIAPVLITFVMVFIADRVAPEAGWVAPVTTALALLSIVLPRFVMRRPIEGDDEKRFANWYRTTFFLAFALCQLPFLIAFVLCFMVDALLPVLIALPGFLIGMLGIAPTRRNLDELQRRVAAGGSAVDVIVALTRPAPATRT